MIDESNTSTTPRWLRTAAWIAVICALPLGIVYCGEPDTPAAVDDATEAADVEANDAALASDGDDTSRDRGMARVNQLRRDLRAQVAAGEITGEQARQRISRALQRLEAAGGETAGDQASADQPSEGDGMARINQLRRTCGPGSQQAKSPKSRCASGFPGPSSGWRHREARAATGRIGSKGAGERDRCRWPGARGVSTPRALFRLTVTTLGLNITI